MPAQRQIHEMVAGLGIGNVEPVEQHLDLVEGGSADGQIGLHPVLLPLADHHAGHHLQGLGRGSRGHAIQVVCGDHVDRSHQGRESRRDPGPHHHQGFGDPQAVPSDNTYDGSPDQPFPWLTWLNRPFASPTELMLVPRVRSSQLFSHDDNGVETFSLDDGSNPYANAYEPFGHLMCFLYDDTAPTANPNWKRHRLLEFVRVPSRFVGTELQGNPTSFTENITPPITPEHSFHPPFNRISHYREPGRVNLNTIASENVWRGLMNFLTRHQRNMG